ncbi:MAG: MarP family serine protease [Acidimicrobiia bacterium]
MNWLDAVITLVACGAAYAGYRYGLMTRALSWLGLSVGVIVGVLFVDDVANELRSSTPSTRLVGSLAFLFLMTVIGQTVGIAIGSLLRRHLPARGILSVADRTGGALAGGFAIFVIIWLLTPALASAPGWPARTARGSAIVRAVDRYAPAPPDSLETLGRLVDAAPFPGVFDLHDRPEDVGPPPGGGLLPGIAARVARSVVKIEGRACDLIQQGSGWVVASDLVVTNAHVVAGEQQTTVFTTAGRRLDALVVLFDSERDLAVLRVPSLDLDALPQADGDLDAAGAVMGYPGGGSLRQSPARIAEEILAEGTNIYRSASTVREVYVLAAALAPGDSGGPLFDAEGRVVGVAFAVDPGADSTAYALTHGEVAEGIIETINADAATPVGTGRCLVG